MRAFLSSPFAVSRKTLAYHNPLDRVAGVQQQNYYHTAGSFAEVADDSDRNYIRLYIDLCAEHRGRMRVDAWQ